MTATAEKFDLTIDGSAASTPQAPGTPSVRTANPRATNNRLSTAIAERRHVPKRSGKSDPTGHLTAEDVEALAMELDELRQQVLASRGASDAAYIRKVIDVQRKIELASRAVLLFSIFPPAWIVGTAGLSVAKILDNMEVGHNILHGQWDWMRDPKIHSTTWEWDSATPAELWKHSHNELHHTYTNVLGKDNDLGYGIMRVDEDQRWVPAYLGQPLYNFLNMCFFQYGIAAYDLEIGKQLAGRGDKDTFRRNGKLVLRKVGRQARKDYLIHPLLSGPSFLHTMAANATANFVRNVWTHSIIMCGHFPAGVETFARASIEGESRGEWYLRQMLGSANISGSKAMHIMSGNLSHQIEHHLFPDLPSNRYGEIAPRVQEICERYGLTYTTGPLYKQVASAWGQVISLSLPNPEPGRTRVGIAAATIGKQLRRKLRNRRPVRTA
ncbi:acyl-CoA desaturase [Nostocoides sp. HKS02]|uniref:fatty acid desaturase family protein n=1 Tax=Nostocoides sp. HKS02 TaxID=1813880 RepID=UPI0012B4733D|nr:acyl-CoA desaturase [Tetrasphaera sp. HKS02]QGN56566.1 acyl-CoA desaturase [Tetrasphaera sp. HKS02]